MSTERQPESRAAAMDQARDRALAGADARRHRTPLKFFVLVFTLSIPFWFLAAMTDLQLMPGLSISALGAFCPAAVALILLYRDKGLAGVTGLLKRSFDFERIESKRWLMPVFLLMPAVSVVVYGLMQWLDMPLPAQPFAPGPALLMFLAFFVGALGEELGWSGYVIDPLQDRWNALKASLAVGVVGVVWHIVPLLLLQRPLAWIAWWCFYAMAARVLTVWLYNNTGRSVFAASLFHATLNLTYMLFPVHGSHFDMQLGGLVMAGAAGIVTVIWGPRTLARFQRV